MSRPRLRPLLLAAIVAAAALNVHGLVLNFRAHARLRECAFATVRARVAGLRSIVGQRVALGGVVDPGATLARARAEGDWDAIEAFDADGKPLAGGGAGPRAPGAWLSPRELAALRAGAVLVGEDPDRRGEAIVAYAVLPIADGQPVVRFAAPSPEVAQDRQERQLAFLGHAATLFALLLSAGLLLAPAAPPEPAPPRALIAYEEAMERLRDHGEEQEERHEAERRRMESVLRDKEALARAGELTTGIVHEVRNGLGTIVGYARLVEKDGRDAGENARHIRDECEALEGVIRRFVDFVKRETLVLAPVDLGAMLQRVVARESRRAGAPVAVDAGAAGAIVADEGLLERAFENVVRNAREAAGGGGRVWVTAARSAASASVTVSDDGPGMGPDVRAALRPFFTTKAGGLGLGLAITLKIVRLHDGELVLGDRPPRGTAVTVRLPVAGPRGRDVTEGTAGGGPRPPAAEGA